MEGLLKFIGIIGLMFIIACLLALPLMWLWNWLMPDLFDLQTIVFWQALGLNLLSSILFKSASIASKN